MKTLAPMDYASLPELAAPSAYIVVVRDIDTDTFRIDSTQNPRIDIEAVFTDSERRFGIELVSILETEDLATTASELYEQHHAGLSSDWLELDPYQIEELRRSFLQIDAHASLYLSPDQEPESTGAALEGTVSRREQLAGSFVRGSREAGEFRRAFADRPADQSYGARRRRRRRLELDEQERRISFDEDPLGATLAASERVEQFFQSDLGGVVKFVLILIAAALYCIISASR